MAAGAAGAEPRTAGAVAGVVGEARGGDEEEFDYLAYARERALLFWGDAVSLGVVTRAEVEAAQAGLGEYVRVLDEK